MKTLSVLFISIWLCTTLGCAYGTQARKVELNSPQGKVSENTNIKGFFATGGGIAPYSYPVGYAPGCGTPRVNCFPAVWYGPNGPVNTTKCLPVW